MWAVLGCNTDIRRRRAFSADVKRGRRRHRMPKNFPLNEWGSRDEQLLFLPGRIQPARRLRRWGR